MRIIIIGGGASGLIAAISQKMKHPGDDVLVIDHSNKISKKTFASGNGRCNLGNLNIKDNSYNAVLAKRTVTKENVKSLISFYEDLGILIKAEGDLLYPYSLSSETYVSQLVNKAGDLGVNFLINEEVVDYTNKVVITSSKTLNYDKLIIATGGKSQEKFGSNGKMFDILTNHGYEINPLIPGLCPIKTKEDTSSISGQRVKCEVTLSYNEERYFEEGEVLFKDDGLSGIVIFNISSIIARNRKDYDYKISLNLFKDYDEVSLLSKFRKLNDSNNNFIYGVFHKKIADYILRLCKISPKNKYSLYEIEKIISTSRNLEFTYKSNYGFDDSQVTIGGLKLEEINLRMESRKEKNVFFIGEVLDVDGLCGGFNLMWAALSALKVE